MVRYITSTISVAHRCAQDWPGLACSRLPDAPLQIWLQVGRYEDDLIDVKVMIFVGLVLVLIIGMMVMIRCGFDFNYGWPPLNVRPNPTLRNI